MSSTTVFNQAVNICIFFSRKFLYILLYKMENVGGVAVIVDLSSS